MTGAQDIRGRNGRRRRRRRRTPTEGRYSGGKKKNTRTRKGKRERRRGRRRKKIQQYARRGESWVSWRRREKEEGRNRSQRIKSKEDSAVREKTRKIRGSEEKTIEAEEKNKRTRREKDTRRKNEELPTDCSREQDEDMDKRIEAYYLCNSIVSAKVSLMLPERLERGALSISTHLE